MFGFIFSLIFGHFGSRIGLKVLYCMGTVVSGTCGILFGCLAYIQDSRLFIGLSYILWCYEAKLLVVQISDSIFAGQFKEQQRQHLTLPLLVYF